VIAGTAIEPHSRAVFPGNNPKAIMLDLVQPIAAGRQCCGFCRKARRDEPGRQGTLQHAGQIKLCNSDCNQNRAVIWRFGQLVTTPASQGAWWRVPTRRFDSGGSGRSLPAFNSQTVCGYGATLMGADRSFPARGYWFWSCVGSRRHDFRGCFWRCLRNGDYRRDATFSVSPSGAPSRSAPCLICALG